jgi:hypothetical protein
MSTPETPAAGKELWRAPSRLTKDKMMVGLIALLMLAFAGEAIRVAVTAWATGITPQVFGLMPTRELAWNDSLVIIAVAAAGIGFVGYHLLRILVRGLPVWVRLVEEVGGTPEARPAVDETAHLQVAGDGFLKPVDYYFFTDILEVDAVARGAISGGGHQVRLRLRGRRLAVAVARFDTAVEAAELARRLEAERVRVLGLDTDIRED